MSKEPVEINWDEVETHARNGEYLMALDKVMPAISKLQDAQRITIECLIEAHIRYADPTFEDRSSGTGNILTILASTASAVGKRKHAEIFLAMHKNFADNTSNFYPSPSEISQQLILQDKKDLNAGIAKK